MCVQSRLNFGYIEHTFFCARNNPLFGNFRCIPRETDALEGERGELHRRRAHGEHGGHEARRVRVGVLSARVIARDEANAHRSLEGMGALCVPANEMSTRTPLRIFSRFCLSEWAFFDSTCWGKSQLRLQEMKQGEQLIERVQVFH